MNSVEVHDLFKEFKLPHDKNTSLKQTLLHFQRRRFERLEVLKGISLKVKKGEFFGILGRNGSGKSTLLKILAGIYQPTSGSVNVNGLLTPFIELGVGFNPELTGRDNVYLNGAIFGLTPKQINELYNEIVAFAELEKFMDQKLKNYSSGMQVRLAFSIAIQAQSQILLIDEVLAVGDVKFQRKCLDVFRQLKKSGRTIIFISHDLAAVEEFCDRAVLINEGKILAAGVTSQVIAQYQTLMSAGDIGEKREFQHIGTGEVQITKIRALSKGKAVMHVPEGEPFDIEISYKASQEVANPVFGLALEINGLTVAGPNTMESRLSLGKVNGSGKVMAGFNLNPLAPGVYNLTASCFNEDLSSPYDFVNEAGSLQIIGKERHGIINLEPDWSKD
ncbi:MAG TPA: ABC transporter ATP-binding protein [Candidatus Saccharimonadales bacterium]|nr:ABC transporter ATP-binding protein [Candidatus Saccharimonadales bacterium]